MGGRRVWSCKRGTGVVVEKNGTGGVPALELELELELKLGLPVCNGTCNWIYVVPLMNRAAHTHTYTHTRRIYIHTYTQTGEPKEELSSDRLCAIGRSQIQ